MKADHHKGTKAQRGKGKKAAPNSPAEKLAAEQIKRFRKLNARMKALLALMDAIG